MMGAENSALLVKQGIRPSPQRLVIFGYLHGRKDHPSAERIYRDLVGVMPTLSRTTVYNTLRLFRERGLVQPVGIEDGELRYDADMSEHDHFKCTRCGRVTDVRGPSVSGGSASPELEGCVIHSRHLYYRGICRECVGNTTK